MSEAPPATPVVDDLVAKYQAMIPSIELFQQQLLPALMGSGALVPHIHSVKTRLKDVDHLREKLQRKLLDSVVNKSPFTISVENLLTEVNDLVGVRILHLYTRQIASIDGALKEIFDEHGYELLEGPFARTWDDESRSYFESCGIEVQPSPTLYTSVHYVIGSASRTKVTCEIQVRTLMEEVWGEVDHAINYPHPTTVLASSEQLKVLARVTSSATRLVDAIFLTHEAKGESGGSSSLLPE